MTVTVQADALLKMSGLEKVAALLMALGRPVASTLVRRLDEHQVERVAAALLRTESVEADVQAGVVEEAFVRLTLDDVDAIGGEAFATELFRKALGEARAHELITRVEELRRIQPFEFLRSADPIRLADALSSQPPQMIALVLAQLDPPRAAAILNSLEEQVRADVAYRIATTDQVAPDVLDAVLDGLRLHISKVTTETSEIGGPRPVAQILNAVDRTTERRILSALDGEDPPLAEQVRAFMFVFEDIAKIESRTMQIIVRKLEQKDIALALRSTTEDVRAVFFGAMSQRSGEMLREEMAITRAVRLREVEEAQGRIVAVIRKMEDAEEIILGGDELLDSV